MVSPDTNKKRDQPKTTATSTTITTTSTTTTTTTTTTTATSTGVSPLRPTCSQISKNYSPAILMSRSQYVN